MQVDPFYKFAVPLAVVGIIGCAVLAYVQLQPLFASHVGDQQTLERMNGLIADAQTAYAKEKFDDAALTYRQVLELGDISVSEKNEADHLLSLEQVAPIAKANNMDYYVRKVVRGQEARATESDPTFAHYAEQFMRNSVWVYITFMVSALLTVVYRQAARSGFF